MYNFPYDSGEVEPRHYKLEWLSLLGAVAAALVLLAVAYFINNHDGLQRIAFICIVVAGFTVALCLTALLVHLYVNRQRTKPDHDAPPSYKAAWRRAFYSRRMTETGGPAEIVSGTHLPHSNLEPQPGSPPDIPDHLGCSTHSPRSCTPDLPPHTSHTTGSPASSSPAPFFHHKQNRPWAGSNRTRHYSFDEFYVTNDPPSYDEAMQSIDLSCLQSLRHNDEIEDDE